MPSVLKRIRQRFGLSARQVRVRAHLAWYWRWLALALLAAFSIAFAEWIYDAGRRFAGFDKSELERELSGLRTSVERLKVESERLRAIANASESRLKVEQAAQAQLVKQVKVLEEDNARLKEDLAFFENLAPSSERVTIYRFTVRPDLLPGEFHYRLLVVMGGARRDREFQGSVQLVVNLESKGRQSALVIPAAGQEAPGLGLNFKYFQRVEGQFRVPDASAVRAVQVRILERGSKQALAVQSVDLS